MIEREMARELTRLRSAVAALEARLGRVMARESIGADRTATATTGTVDAFGDLAALSPQDGWTRLVTDENTVYEYYDGEWRPTTPSVANQDGNAAKDAESGENADGTDAYEGVPGMRGWDHGNQRATVVRRHSGTTNYWAPLAHLWPTGVTPSAAEKEQGDFYEGSVASVVALFWHNGTDDFCITHTVAP